VAEARAIALAMHRIDPPRPQTHDLMRSLVESLGAKLEEVWVHELRGNTYYGLLRLRVRGQAEPLFVDTRPSDGLALAARTGAAIKLGKAIVERTPAVDFTPPEAADQVVQIAGLTAVAVSEEIRRQRSLPDRPGVLVVAVDAEAAAAGLDDGDFVVAVNGKPIATPMELLDAVRRRAAPHLPVRVTYWRAGEERTVDLVVEGAAEPPGTRV
jgi:bifunctional DNase/RNase